MSVVIELRSGEFSNVGGRVGTVLIAMGTLIENAVGGSGNDTLRGNEAANVLTGSSGNDILSGMGGPDILVGGAGADSFLDLIAAQP